MKSSEPRPNSENSLHLPSFPLQHYPPELPPARRHGIIGFLLLLVLLPPISAIGGICAACLWAGKGPTGWVDLTRSALFGAASGTVTGLFTRAHLKLNVAELLLVGLAVGAIPYFLIEFTVYVLSFFRLDLGP